MAQNILFLDYKNKEIIIKGYKIFSYIGCGMKGQVYKGIRESDNSTIAIKVIQKKQLKSQFNIENTDQKIQMLKKLSKKRVCQLDDISQEVVIDFPKQINISIATKNLIIQMLNILHYPNNSKDFNDVFLDMMVPRKSMIEENLHSIQSQQIQGQSILSSVYNKTVTQKQLIDQNYNKKKYMNQDSSFLTQKSTKLFTTFTSNNTQQQISFSSTKGFNQVEHSNISQHIRKDQSKKNTQQYQSSSLNLRRQNKELSLNSNQSYSPTKKPLTNILNMEQFDQEINLLVMGQSGKSILINQFESYHVLSNKQSQIMNPSQSPGGSYKTNLTSSNMEQQSEKSFMLTKIDSSKFRITFKEVRQSYKNVTKLELRGAQGHILILNMSSSDCISHFHGWLDVFDDSLDEQYKKTTLIVGNIIIKNQSNEEYEEQQKNSIVFQKLCQKYNLQSVILDLKNNKLELSQGICSLAKSIKQSGIIEKQISRCSNTSKLKYSNLKRTLNTTVNQKKDQTFDTNLHEQKMNNILEMKQPNKKKINKTQNKQKSLKKSKKEQNNNNKIDDHIYTERACCTVF
ncbi:Protein kinase-like domain [Pseudocohnilembus persalinus]|uniref:Protein kinase-like domain n=1 Tax=Pseudocohnilembus persalinus TaxID=266149 RepID=A0A0V0QJA9_PSEPJ|nr:Protein kinase-like domain [Pseudocohnilembus persalinus]|eukprot:KRX02302.1 Protein kinase-like domain [Pseudocohnilembus persalinus]